MKAFKDESYSKEFPKTLLIRNIEGGRICQVYRVSSLAVAEAISINSKANCIITLEDFSPEYEETFPDWRDNCSESIRKLLLKEVTKFS